MRFRGWLRGAAGRALQRFAETILEPSDIKKFGTSFGIVDKASIVLAGSSALARLFLVLALVVFDWGMFFFDFKRFSQSSARARRRYLRMWMKSKIAIARHTCTVLKMVVLSCFYDARHVDAGLRQRT